MNVHTRLLLFVLFFLSGFCSLLYQIVWLRLAFAAFGVITPVVSVLLSVFMLGLALGSWLGGRGVLAWTRKSGWSPMVFYGLAEGWIAVGSLVVPRLFQAGTTWLLGAGGMDSVSYLLLSALIMAMSILPWCVCMGATVPLVLAYIQLGGRRTSTWFSYLYLANVLGAMAGTSLTAVVLVETLGFSNTLGLAAAINTLIAVTAVAVGLRNKPMREKLGSPEGRVALEATLNVNGASNWPVMLILFLTGFSSVGMEAVWTRAFTPITLTTVYAFALLLGTYLFATALGSWLYRRHLAGGHVRSLASLLGFVSVTAYLPLIINDPRWDPTVKTVVVSLVPLCAGLGYLTPLLIDGAAQGRPQRVGSLYAVNIVGCTLGPLIAGYVLLPLLGVKWALILFAMPFTLLAFLHAGRNSGRLALKVAGRTVAVGIVGMAMLFESYEESAVAKQLLVRRDHTATVLAFGEGRGKELIVNGFSMTELTPITKVMAHLPLAHLTTLPTSALVIGLGMGTSFRSAMSWGIETKAVELVPSVKEVFGFFHQDGPQLLETGRGQVVIDDGRRFLARTGEQFDVIVIDPPPPVEAAGSSLLYSEEFYALAKKRLREGGILQQWLPGGEERILSAVAGALARSFIYIRVYQDCGFHFLASTRPILPLRAEHLVARMPEAAKHDLLEWNLALTAVEMLGRIVNNEVDIGSLIHLFGPDSEFTITDDRPFNEYFLLRRTTGSAQAAPSFSSQVPCPLSP